MFGSVEFTAPSSYLVEGRNPTPLSVAFLIDVSLPALTSGLLQAASAAILSAIPALEQSSGGQARVGVIVYDSEVHFFDMKTKKGDGSISQATVCDVNESFCPLSLSQWTGSLSEPGTRPQLEHLLSRLPSLFQANVARPKQSVSGAALKAAVEGLSDSGGRVVMFQAQLPLSGEGSLQVRESPKSYGTDKEKEMYSPATGDAGNWYSELAKLAAGRGVCIDLHMCTPPGAYCDLPTQATLSARTGGEMIVYPFFLPPTGQGSEPTPQRLAPINSISEEAQNRMNFDLTCKLGREYGTEAVLKVRTSPGLRTHKYVGNFEDRADNEADLAGVDSEKSILVTLQHDGAEIKNGDDMFVQAALLFTNSRGQRRVRIHNLKMVAADTVQSVFRHADVDAILSHMLRVSVQTTLTKDAKFVEKDLEETSIEMLYAYRKHCATNSSQGQLILPESLKLLPLYISTVLKLQAFAVNGNRSGKTSHSKSPFADINVRVDARLVELVALSSISPGRVVPFLYPRMFRVDNLAAQFGIPVPLMQQQQLGGIDIDSLPPPRPSSELSSDDLRTLVLPPVVYPSIEQINSNPNAMYLVDHRFGIFLVVGSTVDEDSFVQVFGGASANSATLPPNTPLVMYDSDLSKRIWACISAIKQRRDNFYMPVSVISAIDVEGRELLKTLMVEDKGKSGGKSYVEILCDIHTSIQAKLMST
jgi:protein transport protein SEC24